MPCVTTVRPDARSGSVLILCLGIMAAMIGFAFVFVRSMQLQHDGSRASRAAAWARMAAESGQAAGMRSVIQSYVAPSGPTGWSTGVTTPSDSHVTAYAPFNRQDRNGPTDEDDVRSEDAITDVYIKWKGAWASRYRRQRSLLSGYSYANTRGRWIEPGFSNAIRFTDLTATSASTDTVFLDGDLQRIAGLTRGTARYRIRFANSISDLDGSLLSNPAPEYDYRRIQTLERNAALFSGADVVNLANVTDAAAHPADPKWSDPNRSAGLTQQERWMQEVRRSAPSWASIYAGALLEGGVFYAARMEHVWNGRGLSSNVARVPHAIWGGLPGTFGSMYRVYNPAYTNTGVFARYSGNDPSQASWRFHGEESAILLRAAAGNGTRSPTGGDVIDINTGSNPLGGVVSHNRVGAQLSFLNQYQASHGQETGWEGEGDELMTFLFTPYGRGVWTTGTLPLAAGTNAPEWTSLAKDYRGTWFRDQIGPVHTPWRLNPLTASPRAVSGMLLGMLPPYLKTVKFTQMNFLTASGNVEPITYTLTGTTVLTDDPTTTTPPHTQWVAGDDIRFLDLGGRELFIPYLSDAFRDAGYRNPIHAGATATAAAKAMQAAHQPAFAIAGTEDDDPVIAYPSSSGYDAAQYQPDKRYPGRFMVGRYAVADEGEDDLGELVDASEQRVPSSPISGAPFIVEYNGEFLFDETTAGDARIAANRPAGWGSTTDARLDRGSYALDPTKYKFRHSYWWDIVRAGAYAIAYTQAQWRPAGLDDRQTASTLAYNPGSFDSVAELDALFLRQLGENIIAGVPNAPQASQAFKFNTSWDGYAHAYMPYTPAYNIRTLTPQLQATDDPSWGKAGGKFLLAKNLTTHPKNASGALVTKLNDDVLEGPVWFAYQRSRVMERMVNDVRMSLFGASPQYWQTFTPYDFNGDDLVECTAFKPRTGVAIPFASPPAWMPATLDGHLMTKAEVAAGTWRTDPTKATWFCLTGTFCFGKSQFYRIFTKGELYDNLLQKSVASITKESVIMVDANRDMWSSVATPNPNGSATDTQILFQRWHAPYNRSNSVNSYP